MNEPDEIAPGIHTNRVTERFLNIPEPRAQTNPGGPFYGTRVRVIDKQSSPLACRTLFIGGRQYPPAVANERFYMGKCEVPQQSGQIRFAIDFEPSLEIVLCDRCALVVGHSLTIDQRVIQSINSYVLDTEILGAAYTYPPRKR